MEQLFANKVFVSNIWIIIMNDPRSVNVAADIGIQYSGDHQSGDARPSLTFFVFIQVLTLCAFIVDGAEFGRG